jgi:hypothetical protein
MPPVDASNKYFTVEEANRALPLVRAIVGDIVRQFQVVNDLSMRLNALSASGRKRPTDDVYAEELAASEAQLEAEQARLDEYVVELRGLGIEFKGPDGLCDFPSLHEGREIYLCWRLGEPSVSHWHEIHTGFMGRQPIADLESSRVKVEGHH